MTLTPEDFAAMVQAANLAPSVHNTQPTRWRLDADGGVTVLEAVARRLPVGDPEGRDAAVSHGAAIEGFALVCGTRGLGASVQLVDGEPEAGLRPVARLSIAEGGLLDPLQAFLAVRRTYRGTFVRGGDAARLQVLAAADDITLVAAPDGLARLAELNDEASLRTYRDRAYRAELLSWMRLSRRHPRWAVDGLNAEAMEMSGVEAVGAGVVLRPGVFEALDRLGAARMLVAEAAVVRSAAAVVLFHRPDGEDPLLTGRRFHRLWLDFASLGFSAAPMAVLADDLATRAIIAREFSTPPNHRLITAFRVGSAPDRKLGPKPRLPSSALIV
ncbi:MAG TPA: hypothetical protein VN806_06405 [Caulobacteraceae bacterium]|nr:hypothetical protein [Caulobacteraceae bacterium]